MPDHTAQADADAVRQVRPDEKQVHRRQEPLEPDGPTMVYEDVSTAPVYEPAFFVQA
ncbi:hypothetical protein ACFY8C_39045 [Streptomyces flavochromogenes]|jgi:hypothetical protein|uniref:Uncharacterized protein n=1 Tax=Streptomyces flavochromogenes TaxID=68199 RepID=A0ABW6Y3C2_9ACTN|nr:hypothetical protein [Streptomyces flavochromogenes]